jgi:hypothetical protein
MPGGKTELYFGSTLAGPNWNKFLHDVVTPRFPAFTIIDGLGSWKGSQMPSKIMVIFHSGSETDEKSIESIRKLFIEQFKHDSVLRANMPSNFDF